MKLGSLFDGSGGFPLAGVLNGIEPVWASEIEPFPIRVTKNRFPNMKHLGSVTDINGAEIEPVDIITFGSPCQDLSVAGKQLGIHDGQRSNLFFEAIRIIKEMREHDRATGRTGIDVRPRFAVWENVPGAFSSNKGQDFQAVLQAICQIRGGHDHIVPLPPKGKWLPAGCIVGDGWSVAWRVYDAQFWGVPQRRKRIYLIADFGSERAGEILFERESVRGNSETCGETREGTAADAQGSTGRSNQPICLNFQGNKSGCCTTDDGTAYSLNAMHGHDVHVVVDSVKCLNPWDAQSIRQFDANGCWPPLQANSKGGQNRNGVCYPINTMVATRGGKDDMRTCFGIGEPNDPQFTISAAHEHAVCYALDSMSSNSMKSSNPHSGFHEETISKTLDTNPDPTCNQGGNVIVQKVCYSIEGNTVDRKSNKNEKGYCEDVSPTLNTQDKHAVTYAIEWNGQRESHQGDGYSATDKMYTLNTIERHAVCYRKSSKPGADKSGERWVEDEKTNTLNGFEFHSDVRTPEVVCYPDKARSLCARADSSPCIDRGQNVVCVQNTGRGWRNEGEVAETLRTPCGGDSTKANLVVHALDCRNMADNVEVSGTIQAKNEGGHSLNFINPVVYDARGNGGGVTVPTITGDHNGHISDYTCICVERNTNE